MSEKENENKECILLWNILQICEGDKVEIYLKGLRSLMLVKGKILELGEHAMLIETRHNHLAIRYSEIRMLRKIQNK